MKTTIKPLLIIALVLLLSNNQNIAQNVGIGAESFIPDESAMLEVKSTEKGFLPPRMTTAERDLIQNPAEGLMIFNVTTKCIEYFAYGIWQSFNCAVCPAPNTPIAGTHVPSETQIVWSWNSVGGADGYKYNTVNDYTTATDNETSTIYTQTGLICGTEYTLYVWAYNACGNSIVLTLTQTTSACPFTCGTSTVTFTYNGSPVTYGTVTSNSNCWLDRNLGAYQVATSSTDHLAYGDLFQWGRAADGHQLINWSGSTNGTPLNNTTAILSTTDQPSHSLFITNINPQYDWHYDNNNNRWNASPIVNNPCPNGWRIPTQAEWQAELDSWPSNQKNSTGAFNSTLKLPRAGNRSLNTTGTLETGNGGYYWSSSPNSHTPYSTYLNFYNSLAHMPGNGRAYGFSVRCIKD